MKHIYLGDGVYAEFNELGIKLWTDREEGRHWICLEPEVLAALFQFAASKGLCSRKEPKQLTNL